MSESTRFKNVITLSFSVNFATNPTESSINFIKSPEILQYIYWFLCLIYNLTIKLESKKHTTIIFA